MLATPRRSVFCAHRSSAGRVSSPGPSVTLDPRGSSIKPVPLDSDFGLARKAPPSVPWNHDAATSASALRPRTPGSKGAAQQRYLPVAACVAVSCGPVHCHTLAAETHNRQAGCVLGAVACGHWCGIRTLRLLVPQRERGRKRAESHRPSKLSSSRRTKRPRGFGERARRPAIIRALMAARA
ncbi:hypothetical protein GY45DRAFT_759100 [Cubamyces sp. BRFM 1775]|nr:hypothetical protein GY45DRAFT_759100 [Cubamyces sp. BRFM 1775]